MIIICKIILAKLDFPFGSNFWEFTENRYRIRTYRNSRVPGKISDVADLALQSYYKKLALGTHLLRHAKLMNVKELLE